MISKHYEVTPRCEAGLGGNVDMVVDMTDCTTQKATEVSKRIKDNRQRKRRKREKIARATERRLDCTVASHRRAPACYRGDAAARNGTQADGAYKVSGDHAVRFQSLAKLNLLKLFSLFLSMRKLRNPMLSLEAQKVLHSLQMSITLPFHRRFLYL